MSEIRNSSTDVWGIIGNCVAIDARDLAAMRRTCKRLKQIVDAKTTSLTVHRANPDAPSSLLNRLTHLQTLHLVFPRLSPKTIFPSRLLHLHVEYHTQNHRPLLNFLSQATQLRSLSVRSTLPRSNLRNAHTEKRHSSIIPLRISLMIDQGLLSHLEALSLQCTGLTNTISTACLPWFTRLARLTNLDLSHNELSLAHPALLEVAKNTNLQRLALNNLTTPLDDLERSRLLETLAASRVPALELNSNSIGNPWLKLLGPVCGTLKKNPHTKKLDLSNSEICPEDAKHIVHLLTGNQTLTSLDLSNNSIDTPTAVKLINLLRTNKTLQLLDLRGNPFNREAAKNLMFMLGVDPKRVRI